MPGISITSSAIVVIRFVPLRDRATTDTEILTSSLIQFTCAAKFLGGDLCTLYAQGAAGVRLWEWSTHSETCVFQQEKKKLKQEKTRNTGECLGACIRVRAHQHQGSAEVAVVAR